jgi:two-component system sensor histidine kinase YesM
MKFSGIGISNVNERLKLHYGSRHGLKIDSAVGKGTVCKVWIPKVAD